MIDEELGCRLAEGMWHHLREPMTTAGLRKRVDKLAHGRARPADCPGAVTVILPYRQGEPEPLTPPDALRCPLCGEPHVLIVEEIVVQNREQAAAALRGCQEARR